MTNAEPATAPERDDYQLLTEDNGGRGSIAQHIDGADSLQPRLIIAIAGRTYEQEVCV